LCFDGQTGASNHHHRPTQRPNRDIRATARTQTEDRKEEGTTMNKFGFASIVASGLTAAVLGLAAPAQADLGHNTWVNQIGPSVTVPQVDTSVHQSR
jgi:hypothetical protein